MQCKAENAALAEPTDTKVSGANKDTGKNLSEKPAEKAYSRRVQYFAISVGVALSLVGLYFLRVYSYLLFHSVTEIFTIVITFAIFVIAWNSRRTMDNHFLLFIGIASLFVGGLDLIHTLAYKDMGVFPAPYSGTTNLATQLWIATRYLLSISFLLAVLFVRRKFKPSLVFAGYTVALALIFASIFWFGNFPTAFVDAAGPDQGLTTFKIGSEFLISGIFACSIVLLFRARSGFSRSVLNPVVAALAVAIAAELIFTLYSDPFGVSNMLGHLLVVVSFFLIYRAIVETGIKKPYDLLFRNLKQKETVLAKEATELSQMNARLVEEVVERKKIENALVESSREWERTFDSVPDFIAVLDSQYRIVRANKPMATQLDGSPEQCVGLYCYKCVHGTDQQPDYCPHTKTLKDGLEHTEEIFEPHLGGHFMVSTTPLKNQKGEIIGSVHVARNITRRKEMEQKLEQYSRHLETLVEEKTKELRDSERLAAIGQTAGMVGHDIRNPLQAIMSDLYLEKLEVAALPEGEGKANLLESITCIEQNLFYINKIVADLQDYASTLKPRREDIDLEKTIKEVLTMVAIPKTVQVQVSAEKGYPHLTADSTMMKRVLVNLVQNAVQAMPNGGTLTIKPESKRGRVLINIEDTGEGIPDEAQDKIFKPLFTTKSKGQGFGLAVVKRLVEAQGGTISFESKVGKGTKFMVKFPQ
jgi:PAS domain S-box-containing protein